MSAAGYGNIPARQSNLCGGLLLAFILTLTSFSPVYAAEYRVDVGDVLELTALNIPEFRFRASVANTGEIVFPLVGKVQARNRSVGEILGEIQKRVPQKMLRRRSPDGGEHVVVIDGDEISLSIAEYSPVYLKGDVTKPGSYQFRPGLTVRQAIALAGGYDALRSGMGNPYLLTVDLRSQRETLINQYTLEQARIARIQAELGQEVKAVDALVSSRISAEIRALEAEQLEARNIDFEKEKQHLEKSIQSLAFNLDLLEKQMKTEAERAKIDLEDMGRVESLVAKGMAPVTRLSEVRRLVLLSASRATEIEARVEQVKQRRADEERKLQRLFDERNIKLLKELQERKIELATVKSRLSALTDKMLLVGAVRLQLSHGVEGDPEFVIVRQTASGIERLSAEEDSELLPRDVVEVTLLLHGEEDIDMHQSSQTKERLGSLSE